MLMADNVAKGKLPFWLVLLGVLVVFGGVGFGMGRLFSNPAQADADGPALKQTDGPSKEYVYFNLFEDNELAVNIDDPRMNRIVVAPITVALRPEAASDGTKLIQKEKASLKHMMASYFAGCTLDDLRGTENRNRIAREILDMFNDKLWPDSTPLIKEVLLGDLKVQ
jgi:flagellar basal body-associated protein FliL